MTDAAPPFLQLDGVGRIFRTGRGLPGRKRPVLRAVRSVSLEVDAGETLGIVGESGCGKSTLARMIAGLDRPSSGTIRLQGNDVSLTARADFRALARTVQYVFQDPISSLNPRKTIRAILEAPLINLLGLERTRRRARLAELIDAVGLDQQHLERYPHEFSGGQAQRIAIARALAAEPRMIVLDEPVSALDVSIQAQIINILNRLRARFNLTYIFISHDLSVVEAVSDRVVVMYFGNVVEAGPTRTIFAKPRHHYTRLLLRSVPVPGRAALPIESESELPDPFASPVGCPFHPRCPAATDRCRTRIPELRPDPLQGAHLFACFHPDSVTGSSTGEE